ncbi:MAG: hypothetical protein ACWGQW_00670 [bacterium]
MENKISKAIMEQLNDGLAGDESTLRLKLRVIYGINVSTKQVRAALDTLYSEGRITARRFGNGTDISWFVE